MDWGTFLIGLLVGGFIFGMAGLTFGCLLAVLYVQHGPVTMPFHEIIRLLKENQAIYGDFFFSTKPPRKDDDGGHDEENPEPSLSLDSSFRNN